MTRIATLVAACTAVALMAGAGMAQTPNPPAPRPPIGQPSPAPGAMAMHTMEGEVTKVDAKKGWIDVKTAEGRMKLHYPSAALENVKKGDSVTVEIGLRPAR